MSKVELIHGDCMEAMAKMKDNSIDMVITDPPYSTPTITSFGRKKVLNLADLSIQEFYFKKIKEELERILKPDGRVFVFCDDKYYPVLFGLFYEWQNKNLIIWDKGKIGMGNPFRKQHELIFYANRESYEYKRTNKITHYSTILKYKSDPEKIHGAQKPLQLITDLILGFSNEGDEVLDLFAGSGTTGIACFNINRNATLIELNKDYYEAALDRFNRHKQQLVMEF